MGHRNDFLLLLEFPPEFVIQLNKSLAWNIVRQLNNKFGVDVDVPDESVNFFPQASHCLRFIFLVGTTSADDVIASILRF